jgi:hypothetical protein
MFCTLHNRDANSLGDLAYDQYWKHINLASMTLFLDGSSVPEHEYLEISLLTRRTHITAD